MIENIKSGQRNLAEELELADVQQAANVEIIGEISQDQDQNNRQNDGTDQPITIVRLPRHS